MTHRVPSPPPGLSASLATTRRQVLIRGLRLGGGLASAAALAACAGDVGGRAVDLGPQAGPSNVPPVANGPAVALILPLGAQGNAGLVGQSMRNAAELAISEGGAPAFQLIVKDDAGNSQGARAAAEAAINEGARIILGPLFAHSVGAVSQVARARNIPVVAFSTDTNVATQGVYLLSFLPQSDVDRIVRYSIAQGRRSFIAMIPENAYGTVAQGALQQVAADAGGRVMGIERYTPARLADAAKRIAMLAPQADAVFIPDSPDQVVGVVQQLVAAGVDLKKVRPLGTGLWDNPTLLADPRMEGGQFAAPDASGWRNFSQRYRQRFGSDPVRTATLSYDAVSLVSAIMRTQGPEGLTDATLTNPSGFNGVDGPFRFRADGTNERSLAVMEIRGGSAQVVSPPPRSFSS
ncbi:penicillin-binding protein activator [Xanthobacter sp. DSM 24535]|uniref:penicillin-binding protein activator n=1 Tax=Roseixanthobacter psychrophilus TaxID=3119917 RepID=UPI00372A2EFE